MNLSIQFNWPTGEDSAIVDLGHPNVEDHKFEFRIGVIPKEHSDKVSWYVSEWRVGDANFEEITFKVRRGDKVLVHRKQGDNIEVYGNWDITEEWPAEAHGASMTIVPWYF